MPGVTSDLQKAMNSHVREVLNNTLSLIKAFITIKDEVDFDNFLCENPIGIVDPHDLFILSKISRSDDRYMVHYRYRGFNEVDLELFLEQFKAHERIELLFRIIDFISKMEINYNE